MASLEEIRAVLPQVRTGLLERSNVVATGIGYKVSGGRVTDELAIICSVSVKQSLQSLARKDVVPSTIDSIHTDVHPTGVISVLQNPRERMRPALAGVSLGHRLITAGTLGCLVQKNGRVYVLSNNHVMANSNNASRGDSILQPGPADGGLHPQDQLAALSEFVPIVYEQNATVCPIAAATVRVLNLAAAAIGSSTRLKAVSIAPVENRVDCAIAELRSPSDGSAEVLGLGQISGVAEGALGMGVRKSGRTTGVTGGTIQQVDVSVRVNFGSGLTALFVDQLMAGGMSQGGDSGSAVLDERNNIVGLLFAGGPSTTILNRIQNVFRDLNVGLA